MPLRWSDKYAVGVEVIDQQHRELFSQVSALVEALRLGRGGEQVEQMLGFLKTYVVQHFATEEALMARSGYPAAAAHKREHDDFVATFVGLQHQFSAEGPTLALAVQVNNQVGGWLLRHVLGTDRALGAHLKAHPKPAAA